MCIPLITCYYNCPKNKTCKMTLPDIHTKIAIVKTQKHARQIYKTPVHHTVQ